MISGADEVFLEKLKKEIDDNLTNEQFCVETLARNVGISRSQLHRKLNAITGQSVSQFIREHRLSLGMALLKDGALTAAEVADRIGFGSSTYFNKCFHEFYGYPPGEVRNKAQSFLRPAESAPVSTVEAAQEYIAPTPGTQANARVSFQGKGTRNFSWMLMVAATCIVAVGSVFSYRYFSGENISVARKPERTSDSGSIAILPFKNLSEDERNEYFSEGVNEAIRTNLSQVGTLRVISRTSVEQYRRTEKTARDIAGELDVAALLEGSIQRAENSVRIEVRLVDGTSGVQIWAKTYERELKDVFAIQTEIAQQVADELHAKLTAEERSRLSATETSNARAYDLYLQGIYEFRTYTNRGTHNAIDLLGQAIALDSNYARAYAYLAYSHICLASIFGAEQSALDGLRNGKPFIDKALAIDPNLDIAHMLLGFYYLYHDWDMKRVESEYKMAVVNSDPDALAMYADFLNFVRRHDEALVHSEQLNTTDPYYPNSRMVLSYFYTHRLDDAVAFSRKRVQLFNNYYTFDSHGFLMLQVGRYDEAIQYFSKAIALEGIRYPRMLGWMGAAYARAGNPQAALQIIDELKTRFKNGDRGSIPFFIAVVYAGMDNKTAALEWLHTSFKLHDMEMPWIMTEPQFYALHSNPEFQRIAKAVGY
jgi:TolB-like protein/AraC-like DNA-binding protein/Tfp pilus assembly protein PilF